MKGSLSPGAPRPHPDYNDRARDRRPTAESGPRAGACAAQLSWTLFSSSSTHGSSGGWEAEGLRGSAHPHGPTTRPNSKHLDMRPWEACRRVGGRTGHIHLYRARPRTNLQGLAEGLGKTLACSALSRGAW